MKNPLTQIEQIAKTYDYIVAVTIRQNKLLPKTNLWGDGTIHGNNKEIFNSVYNQVEKLLKNIL